MKKSFVGKLIAHAALPLVIFARLGGEAFPEIGIEPIWASVGAFGVFVVLYIALTPLGFFRWYTDPSPDSPPRGGIFKSFGYALCGLLIGAGTYIGTMMALQSLHLDQETPLLLKRILSVAGPTFVVACVFTGVALSGWTGLWNREAPVTPDEPMA